MWGLYGHLNPSSLNTIKINPEDYQGSAGKMPHQPKPEPEVATVLTPTNLLLFALTLTILYLRLRPARAITLPDAPPPVVHKKFTPTTLKPHNGVDLPTVYLAVQGKVYDCTPGKSFYGPGGPYANFAGRDASRGLAFGRFDEEMLEGGPQGFDKRGLDTLEDLGEEEKRGLQEWRGHFEGKYLVVGELVGEGED
ncbi:cytochrome b5 [Ascobolus immersus RN42]|uniref:Cytochrome b5 n=1 Tax=Ascobolus immersus RN42 TaxID=1160509 RepID=A0A3N4H8Y9_ASCIM|nr:cytochrome b5 [Ascobolus immersus RN42]